MHTLRIEFENAVDEIIIPCGFRVQSERTKTNLYD